jgi:hypothetical protein
VRFIFFPLAIIVLGCSPENEGDVRYNRFLESLKSAKDIGTISRLTQDGRSIYPVFAPGDSIVIFKRLLVATAEDAEGRTEEELVGYYGTNVYNNELYTLSRDYPCLQADNIDPSRVPRGYGENIIRALESPDGKTIAFEKTTGSARDSHTIYLAQGDSIIQLTYGDLPCFLERFSNTGKYLSAICGRGPTWIILFDLEKQVGYRIERIENRVDYLTAFSSDDKMMAFIRSEKRFSYGFDFFGDVWLLRFND